MTKLKFIKMAEQEKPFDTTSIVLLTLVSGFSDIADLATDLIFPVPIIGQIVFISNSLVVSPIVWAIIQFSFIMKTGMGRASFVAVAGGLGNIANIPGSETVTTLIGIAMANNPKVSQVASLGAKAEGKGGAVSKKATVGGADKGAGAAETEAKTASATKRDMGAEQEEPPGSGAAKKSGGGQENEISPEALGERPGPMEALQQKLLKETPNDGDEKKLGEEKNVKLDDRNNEVDLRREREGYSTSMSHDKSVDEAMKLRKERAAVAERLGMDRSQAAKKILDAEEEDAKRGKDK